MLPFLPEDQAKAVHRALHELADDLTEAFDSLLPGDTEDQLKSRLRPFLDAARVTLGCRDPVTKSKSRVLDVHVQPDLRVRRLSGLMAHIELKVPDRWAQPIRITARHNG